MNKNKLLALLVLLVTVVGLTIGTVTAESTTTKTITKTKYKVVKVNTKFNKIITKKVGKYAIATNKKRYDNSVVAVVAVEKNKKVLKGNQYYTKIYYKENGKSKVTPWKTGSKKENYQYYYTQDPQNIKLGKIGVKFKVTVKITKKIKYVKKVKKVKKKKKVKKYRKKKRYVRYVRYYYVRR